MVYALRWAQEVTSQPAHVQEKGIDEAFWPLYELDEQPEKGKGSHWLVRTGMALTVAGVVWALHVYVPDKAGAASGPPASVA